MDICKKGDSNSILVVLLMTIILANLCQWRPKTEVGFNLRPTADFPMSSDVTDIKYAGQNYSHSKASSFFKSIEQFFITN